MEAVLQDLGSINFDEENVPINYFWSGYAETKEDFYHNFLIVDGLHNEKVLICSEENIVSLADYLSNYVLCHQLVYDVEELDSPDISIWFFYGCETLVSDVEELPNWMQEIIQLLINERIVFMVCSETRRFYCIPHYQQNEDGNLPRKTVSQLEEICKRYLDNNKQR